MRKALLIGGGVLLLVVLGLVVFVSTKKAASQPARKDPIAATPQRLERGEYLANHVLGCFGCHSERQWGKWGAPIVAETKGAGVTACLTEEHGAPGRICFPNITADKETGIGDWTDGEILRAIREGVDREGNALFPMMPYVHYRSLSDEDAFALVAYLRTVKPVRKEIQESQIDFPVSFFISFEPAPVTEEVVAPPKDKPAEYGAYLATIGGCKSCHTPVDDQHQPLKGKDYSGGQELHGPWGTLKTPNITPHETGLKKYDEKTFVALFKAYQDPATHRVVETGQNTVMPWVEASGMHESDLKAIYAHLQTVAPIENKVTVR